MSLAHADLKEAFERMAQGFARAVVHLGLQFPESARGSVRSGVSVRLGLRRCCPARLDDHAPQRAHWLVGTLARTRANGSDDVGCGQLLGSANGGGDGGARGRHELALHGALREHKAAGGCDVHDGRHGHGQNAVLGAYTSVALCERPYDRVCDIEVVKADGRCHNVDDGVDGTRLMEVNLVCGYAVGLGFRLSQDRENPLRELAGTEGELTAVDDPLDVAEMTVFVMVAPAVTVLVGVDVFVMVVALAVPMVFVILLMAVTLCLV